MLPTGSKGLSTKLVMPPKKVDNSPRRRVFRNSKKVSGQGGQAEAGDNQVPGPSSRTTSFMDSLASRDRAWMLLYDAESHWGGDCRPPVIYFILIFVARGVQSKTVVAVYVKNNEKQYFFLPYMGCFWKTVKAEFFLYISIYLFSTPFGRICKITGLFIQ